MTGLYFWYGRAYDPQQSAECNDAGLEVQTGVVYFLWGGPVFNSAESSHGAKLFLSSKLAKTWGNVRGKHCMLNGTHWRCAGGSGVRRNIARFGKSEPTGEPTTVDASVMMITSNIRV